jgi:hypothetical protein
MTDQRPAAPSDFRPAPLFALGVISVRPGTGAVLGVSLRR